MNDCPLYETCKVLRDKAEKKFNESGVHDSARTTCYNPSWLLTHDRRCELYHPELKPNPKKKIDKVKKTDEDFREEAKKEITRSTTYVEVVERCANSGITNTNDILKELINIFPNDKESKLRGKVKAGLKYLKVQGRIS